VVTLRQRWQPYALLVALLQRWSFRLLRHQSRPSATAASQRIAYVLHRYPALTVTFVRREVQALRDDGIELDVFALGPDDPPLAVDANSPAGPVEYFGPCNEAGGRAALRAHWRRHPWTVVLLWLFVVRHQHPQGKSWRRDRNILYLAGQLSEALAVKGTTHVHAAWADRFALVAFVAARLNGLTYSVQARASEIHRAEEGPAVADRLRFAEFVITNSCYNASALVKHLGGGEAPPVKVIYNGVELPRFRPQAVKRPAGAFHILSVGRLVEQKGFRYLLHACRLLRDRGVDVSCDIIGAPADPWETSTWLELQRLQTDLDLASTVRFLGKHTFTNVLAAFEQTDVFVLPCVIGRDGARDITPNALIEAMAMGLPTVSTTSGAIPEIVDHGRDGLLVPPHDAGALADAIERILGDPDLRRTLGAAARKTVEARFDIDRNVAARSALFRALRTTPG